MPAQQLVAISTRVWSSTASVQRGHEDVEELAIGRSTAYPTFTLESAIGIVDCMPASDLARKIKRPIGMCLLHDNFHLEIKANFAPIAMPM